MDQKKPALQHSYNWKPFDEGLHPIKCLSCPRQQVSPMTARLTTTISIDTGLRADRMHSSPKIQNTQPCSSGDQFHIESTCFIVIYSKKENCEDANNVLKWHGADEESKVPKMATRDSILSRVPCRAPVNPLAYCSRKHTPTGRLRSKYYWRWGLPSSRRATDKLQDQHLAELIWNELDAHMVMRLVLYEPHVHEFARSTRWQVPTPLWASGS